MGIGRHVVEALIRERSYRPLHGDITLIGRQTVYFEAHAILALLRAQGVDTNGVNIADIEIDHDTSGRLQGFADRNLITDRALFRLLGAPRIQALDHSAYEGAEIIHNLTEPIPPKLHESADFILDGSTLDNVSDPGMVIRNFAGMLRPGGRILMTNVFSNHYEPYVMLPPLWFLDFFVMNGFMDCKVYIILQPFETETTATVGGKPSDNVFTIDLAALLDPARAVSAFTAPRMMTTTLVMAEKGPASTSHVMPTQQHYRQPGDWEIYRKNLKVIAASGRYHLARSGTDIHFKDVRGGHLFMSSDFTARDPMTEIIRLEQARPAA